MIQLLKGVVEGRHDEVVSVNFYNLYAIFSKNMVKLQHGFPLINSECAWIIL